MPVRRRFDLGDDSGPKSVSRPLPATPPAPKLPVFPGIVYIEEIKAAPAPRPVPFSYLIRDGFVLNPGIDGRTTVVQIPERWRSSAPILQALEQASYCVEAGVLVARVADAVATERRILEWPGSSWHDLMTRDDYLAMIIDGRIAIGS